MAGAVLDYLTPAQFARLGLIPTLTSASAVRRAVLDGRLPASRLGRRVLLSPAAVKSFLARGGAAGAPGPSRGRRGGTAAA